MILLTGTLEDARLRFSEFMGMALGALSDDDLREFLTFMAEMATGMLEEESAGR